MQSVDLPPSRRRVRQQRHDDIQGIEDDASRADLLDLGLQRRQHPAEVEVPRLDQVGLRLGVHEEQFFLLQLGELPAEAVRIGHNALGTLLKRDKNARLLAVLCAMHQELQREYGLARAWSADQQCGAAAWQAAAGDLIETGDTCLLYT